VALDDAIISKVKVGDKIRVFGTVSLEEEGEIQINASIIQNMNKLENDIMYSCHLLTGDDFNSL